MELFEELDDAGSMAIVGGVSVDTTKSPVPLPVDGKLDLHGEISVVQF